MPTEKAGFYLVDQTDGSEVGQEEKDDAGILIVVLPSVDSTSALRRNKLPRVNHDTVFTKTAEEQSALRPRPTRFVETWHTNFPIC